MNSQELREGTEVSGHGLSRARTTLNGQSQCVDRGETWPGGGSSRSISSTGWRGSQLLRGDDTVYFVVARVSWAVLPCTVLLAGTVQSDRCGFRVRDGWREAERDGGAIRCEVVERRTGAATAWGGRPRGEGAGDWERSVVHGGRSDLRHGVSGGVLLLRQRHTFRWRHRSAAI